MTASTVRSKWPRSIDLLDGSEFADKLRELNIGVRTENIEVVRIEEDWFESI